MVNNECFIVCLYMDMARINIIDVTVIIFITIIIFKLFKTTQQFHEDYGLRL